MAGTLATAIFVAAAGCNLSLSERWAMVCLPWGDYVEGRSANSVQMSVLLLFWGDPLRSKSPMGSGVDEFCGLLVVRVGAFVNAQRTDVPASTTDLVVNRAAICTAALEGAIDFRQPD